MALLVLAFRRLLRGARGVPARAAIAAGFAALVLHTWLYAAVPGGPGDVDAARARLGARARRARAPTSDAEEDAAASLNGASQEPVVVARSVP